MVLYGNMSILGLLILKHHNRRPKSTDFSVYKFIQAIIRFLWDAHNTEESPDQDEYSVAESYLPHWNDLIDLWYLGMQVLSSLLDQVTLQKLPAIYRIGKNITPCATEETMNFF